MPKYSGNGFKGNRGGAVFGIAFGIFWLVAVTSILITSIGNGFFVFPMLLFPGFGILFVFLAIKAAKGNARKTDVPPADSPLPPLPKDEDPFARFDEKLKREEESRNRQETADPFVSDSRPASRREPQPEHEPAPSPVRTLRCRRCGAVIRPGDTFCSKCGNNTRR